MARTELTFVKCYHNGRSNPIELFMQEQGRCGGIAPTHVLANKTV